MEVRIKIGVHLKYRPENTLKFDTFFHLQARQLILRKMQAIIMHANAVGMVFAVESNARSTSWHNVQTNKRGKTIEEYLISRQLHTAYEESWTSRGASNIDLTILSNQAIGLISDWAIHDQESCSHHIIKYDLGNGNVIIQPTGNNKGAVK